MERGKILESSINLKMDKSVRFASQDNFKSLNLFQRSAKTLRSLIIGINERERDFSSREKAIADSTALEGNSLGRDRESILN